MASTKKQQPPVRFKAGDAVTIIHANTSATVKLRKRHRTHDGGRIYHVVTDDGGAGLARESDLAPRDASGQGSAPA